MKSPAAMAEDVASEALCATENGSAAGGTSAVGDVSTAGSLNCSPDWRALSACVVAIVLLAFASPSGFAASGTPLQLKPSSKFDGWQIALKAVLIGAIGVVAVGGGLYAWRTWQRAKGPVIGGNEPASVEWARRVTPRTTMLVVRWNGKRYLLAEGAAQTVLIDSHKIEEESQP